MNDNRRVHHRVWLEIERDNTKDRDGINNTRAELFTNLLTSLGSSRVITWEEEEKTYRATHSDGAYSDLCDSGTGLNLAYLGCGWVVSKNKPTEDKP